MSDSILPDGVMSNGLTIVNICALILVLAYHIIMKVIDVRAKREDDEKLGKLVDGIGKFLNAVQHQHTSMTEFQNEMAGTMSGVRKMMTEILNRNAGVMNRDNSLRIIDQSFSSVIRDIVMIFSNSLETNGYEERRDFIRTRVKTTIGQSLDNLRNSLGYFQMSVDVRPFFRSDATDSQGERYVLANELWELVEPLYRSKLPLKDRLEEMRLIVPNKIRDYVAATRHIVAGDSGSHSIT